MADLKDQLLKAGLITEKQARQVTHQKKVRNKQTDPEQRRRQAEQAAAETRRQAEAARAADRERSAARQAGQAVRERQSAERQRRAAALAAAYREGALPHWEGQRTYYFTDGRRVEMLGVSDEAARRLADGAAAICRPEHGGPGYVLLTGAAARRLAELDPERVVCHHADGPRPGRAAS